MSYSPSLSVVRLQELKLWQGSYENLIQKSKGNSQATNYGRLEGVGVLDNSNASDYSSDGGRRYPKDWDKKKISPCKPFEQMLEEKLAEDTTMAVDTKPKKPFLRKGQGLARFRMGPLPSGNNRNIDQTSRRSLEYKKAPSATVQPKTPLTTRKGILKHHNPLYHQHVDLSPLIMPDFIKPRATWKNVFENLTQDKENVQNFQEKIGQQSSEEMVQYCDGLQEEVENYEEFRMSLGVGENIARNVRERDDSNETGEAHGMFTKSSSSQQAVDDQHCDGGVKSEEQNLSKHQLESFNQKIMEKISEYAKKYFQPSKTYLSNEIPESISEISTPKFKMGDLNLSEQRMERELKAFEELEKKVENSSFCSTNTSVANLLASTPQKMTQNDQRNGNFKERGSIEFTNDKNESVRLKLLEVAQKTDVLQQFLMNLRKMDDKGVHEPNFTLDSGTRSLERSTSTNTSYSEENTRWSTRSPSLTDEYTEYDATCQSDSCNKIDAGVNTSFNGSGLDETVKKLEPCNDCEHLREKLSDTKMKLSEMRSETSNFKTDFKELLRKYEQLKKDMKKNKENYQDTLENLQDELNQERKRLAKEKLYFESYVKDSQNRATKKEREEITQLKQELADAKELLKLKDSKNGATQARLRTQVKQQEKEISELKITLEKLQRENAKLNAGQKFMRRPQEVKMLHEINKNLSKLTEETFKKQVNKPGNDDIENGENERKKSTTYTAELPNKENEKCEKDITNQEVRKTLANKVGFKIDPVSLDLTNSEGLSIEKRYEHVFGGFSSPRNSNVSANLDKTEKTLPDGSTEITYSNGNCKTISADGKVVSVKYFNGDTKETNLRENIIRYHYATADSWHMQYGDGTEVMEYKDGQKCKKYSDGKTEISYPDGSLRIINTDGSEEHQFPDGRKTIKNIQGEQMILLPNGQREIHTNEYKRREYPDGTIRTLRKDGSVETVYSNGRIRLKDSNGVLLMDTLQ